MPLRKGAWIRALSGRTLIVVVHSWSSDDPLRARQMGAANHEEVQSCSLPALLRTRVGEQILVCSGCAYSLSVMTSSGSYRVAEESKGHKCSGLPRHA